jgi:LysM repeat protein
LLLADAGAWRSATAAREHRCAALGPDIALTLDKQRRLCLVDAHRTCATYGAAMRLGGGEAGTGGADASSVRPYPRMAPVRLDHGRLGAAVPRVRPTRTGNGLLLAGLMALAFGAIALTRLTAGDAAGNVAGATSQPVVAASVAPVPGSIAPSTAIPATASPPPAPTAQPTAAVAPSRTYTVRRGDTLSGIAAEFGTSVRAIMDRNGISNARQLRVGAVLEIP